MRGFKNVLTFCMVCFLIIVITFVMVSGPALIEWSKQ